MYYIYEIPGVKVGCTNDLRNRMYFNARKHNVDRDNYIILEEHTCIDKASQREKELSIEKGYGWDGKEYKRIYEKNQKTIHLLFTKEARRKAVANTDYQARERHINCIKARQRNIEAASIPVKAYKAEKYKNKIVNKIYLKSYSSIHAAARDLKVPAASITKILSPTYKVKTIHGYTFEHA